jgi:uncharacterized glyoxalase superfamily protein PhnB
MVRPSVRDRRRFVSVGKVDEHAERARSAGAAILRGPEDEEFGSLYVASDLEGHRWMFLQAPPG